MSHRNCYTVGESRRSAILMVASSLAAVMLPPPVLSVESRVSVLVGTWSALLVVGSQVLRLRLIVEADGSARVVSLDQDDHVWPVSELRINRGRVHIVWPSIHAHYEGIMRDSVRIEGTWHLEDEVAPLAFIRGNVDLSFSFPKLTAARLASARERAGIPALGAAFTAGRQSPVILVDGLRQIGTRRRVTLQDRWHLGSITKSITATLVARGVDSGDLTFDDTVGMHLGNSISTLAPAVTALSFRHLLSHSAGLSRDISANDMKHYSRHLVDARQERLRYAAQALSMPLVGPPGAHFEYSNNGYVIVGAMLEAKFGRPWEELVTEHVFEPLHLQSAGFGAPGVAGRIDEPVGHGGSDSANARGRSLTPYPPDEVHESDNVVALGPAGRVHMNLSDLLAYLRAHCEKPESFLRPEQWQTLHTPPFPGSYAMGWVTRPGNVLWHNGSNDLWYAEVMIDSKRNIVAAATCNDGQMSVVEPVVGRILQEAMAAA